MKKGNINYNWNTYPIIFSKDGNTMVAFKQNDGDYTIIPHDAYMQIKKMVKEEFNEE